MTTTTNSLTDLLTAATSAAPVLAASSGKQRNNFLTAFVAGLQSNAADILNRNTADVTAARQAGLAEPICNRLDLSGGNFKAMVESVQAVAALPDPIGTVRDAQTQASGITVGRMQVPLGVICFIYESRPNVTSDGAALCVKSGNAVILRGGREALATNLAIGAVAHDALAQADLPTAALAVVPTPDRDELNQLLADERLDLVIPRGGAQLVDHVMRTAQAPVLAHLYGNCHLYVEASADLDSAVALVSNAKCQRPGTCNALESLLVDEAIAPQLLPQLAAALTNVELRGCARSCEILSEHCTAAHEDDWRTEYLDLCLSIKVIDGYAAAINWINTYSSHHTDGIITNADAIADQFVREVDSASVLVNTSTRFADGFMYGLGAETGISTGKLHARGPVGLDGLTSTKWVVHSAGSIRT